MDIYIYTYIYYIYIYMYIYIDDTVKLFRKAEVNLAAVKGIIPNLHYQV